MESHEVENSLSSFDRECLSDSVPEVSNDSTTSTKSFQSSFSSSTRRVRSESSRLTLILPDEVADFSPEMQNAYKIVASLMSSSYKQVNVPFLYPIDTSVKENSKYFSVIKRPIWLDKVKTKLLASKYESISQVVRDLRLILENCYRYYGPAHGNSKKAMKLEIMLEQKLALLPRDLKQKTSLELTSPELVKEKKHPTSKNTPKVASWKENSSVILSCVRKARAEQERENRRQQMEDKRAERDANNIELIKWEEQQVGVELAELKTMWELPQIGHFLYLAQTILNIPEVSQFELERAFLMPASSSLLATIMTSLLSSPQQRNKLDKIPAMPYRIWQSRLNLKVRAWYKTFNLKERCLLKVFEVTGVEPYFFQIMGLNNPLESKQYHELTLKQRVWLIKSYCDYCLQNHKSIQEGIFEGNVYDQKEYFLGEDNDENYYINFPQFCGQSVRIYKQYFEERPVELNLSLPRPIIEDIKTEESEKEVKEEELNEEDSVKKPRRGRKRKRVYAKAKVEPKEEPKPKEFTFELVADSVSSLRDLAENFKDWANAVNKSPGKGRGGSNCEKTLYNHLKNLVLELEPWEQKLELAEKKSRYKLRKEWDVYKKRIADNIPEPVNEFWNSDSEEEPTPVTESVQTSLQPSESEPEQPVDLNSSTTFRQTHYRRCTKRQQIHKDIGIVSVLQSSSDSDDSESSSSDSYQVTVSSRGRIRRTRNFGFGCEEKRYKSVENAQKALESMQPNQRQTLEAHRNQNSANDAKMQYQWETMRQKLLTADTNKAAINKIAEKSATQIDLIDSGFGSMKAEAPKETLPNIVHMNETNINLGPLCTKKSPLITTLPKPPAVTFPQYQPKTITKRANIQSRPLIFRQMPKDGGRRVVQTTFSRPGVLKTTVSTNTNMDAAQTNPKTTTNSSYLQKTVQSSMTLNPKMVTTISNVLPSSALGQLTQCAGGSAKKVYLLPVNSGQSTSQGKAYYLKVLPGGKLPANVFGKGVSTSGTTFYTLKNQSPATITTVAASNQATTSIMRKPNILNRPATKAAGILSSSGFVSSMTSANVPVTEINRSNIIVEQKAAMPGVSQISSAAEITSTNMMTSIKPPTVLQINAAKMNPENSILRCSPNVQFRAPVIRHTTPGTVNSSPIVSTYNNKISVLQSTSNQAVGIAKHIELPAAQSTVASPYNQNMPVLDNITLSNQTVRVPKEVITKPIDLPLTQATVVSSYSRSMPMLHNGTISSNQNIIVSKQHSSNSISLPVNQGTVVSSYSHTTPMLHETISSTQCIAKQKHASTENTVASSYTNTVPVLNNSVPLNQLISVAAVNSEQLPIENASMDSVNPSSMPDVRNNISSVNIFSDGAVMNAIDVVATTASNVTFIKSPNAKSSTVSFNCLPENIETKTQEIIFPSDSLASEQMDAGIISTVIGHQQYAPAVQTVQSIMSGSGDYLTLVNATQLPMVSASPVSNEQQISYGVTHSGLIEQQVTPIINIGSNLLTQNPQSQTIRTVLTPVQVPGATQTLQFITSPQLVTETANQNMVLCSAPLLGNTNGFIKTTNLLTAGQSNMFVLTNTGQLMSLSGSTVDGTLVTDNLQAM